MTVCTIWGKIIIAENGNIFGGLDLETHEIDSGLRWQHHVNGRAPHLGIRNQPGSEPFTSTWSPHHGDQAAVTTRGVCGTDGKPCVILRPYKVGFSPVFVPRISIACRHRLAWARYNVCSLRGDGLRGQMALNFRLLPKLKGSTQGIHELFILSYTFKRSYCSSVVSNFFKSYSVLFTNRGVFLKVGKVSDASHTGKTLLHISETFPLKNYLLLFHVNDFLLVLLRMYVFVLWLIQHKCAIARGSVLSRNFQPSFRTLLIGVMSHSRNVPL